MMHALAWCAFLLGVVADVRAVGKTIDRVVSMLKELQARVIEEGKVEEKLHEQIMCWCKDGLRDTKEEIKTSGEKITTLGPRIQIAKTDSVLLEKKIDTLNAEVTENTQSLNIAKELREKENKEYHEESTLMRDSVKGLRDSIQMLDQHEVLSFSNFKSTVRAVQAAVLPFARKDALVKRALKDERFQLFLAQGRKMRGQVVSALQTPSLSFGIVTDLLSEMLHNFEKDLKVIETDEKAAHETHQQLNQGKNVEITIDVEQIRQLDFEKAALITQVSRDSTDLTSLQEELRHAEKYVNDMTENCKRKTAEKEKHANERLEELEGIAAAISILQRDEDALNARASTVGLATTLVATARNATLPHSSHPAAPQRFSLVGVVESDPRVTNVLVTDSATFHVVSERATPVFLQESAVDMAGDDGKHRALSLLSVVRDAARGGQGGPRLTALQRKIELLLTTADFKAVRRVIEEMMRAVDGDQTQDDAHYAWCAGEFTNAQADIEKKKNIKSDSTQQLDEAAEQLDSVTKEIGEVHHNIEVIVESKGKATKARENEVRAFMDELAELQLTQKALYKAIQVLKRVYGDPAFVQVPDPSTWVDDNTGRKSRNTSKARGRGIVATLAQIGEGCVKQEKQTKEEEATSKAAYAKTMEDLDENLRLKQVHLVAHTAIQARTEMTVEDLREELSQAEDALERLQQEVLDLHKDCDFSVKHLEERRNVRLGEKQQMQNAIHILSG
eukprot:GEMP01011348.1.p1 GENE.GEMP01011348.1~~GEMP01011348.1.p1  ORF type:complete len:733 (+),score=243.47 GEMP01011348.1:267-2465(+)